MDIIKQTKRIGRVIDLTTDPPQEWCAPGIKPLLKVYMKNKVYVFKVVYAATAKYITVKAKNEDEAALMAAKRRDVKGCIQIKLMEDRDE